jgi:hypothetical protein
MSYVPLTDLCKSWSTTAKSVNVHLLAISALIKKLAILHMENDVLDSNNSDVKKFVLYSVMARFDKLLIDLEREWNTIVSLDFANSLDYAISIRNIQISKMMHDDSLEQLKAEKEFAQIMLASVDELREISIVDQILAIAEAAKNMSRLSIVSDMLEDKLENKFTLPLLRENSAE